MRIAVGKVYDCKVGTVEIIAEHEIQIGNKKCLFVGHFVPKPNNGYIQAVYPYADDGTCNGHGSKSRQAFDLISDEPTEEEKEIIRIMSNLCRGDYSDEEKSENLLKVIRQLRKK